jgi:sirohydrochlorin cobaltochelatase
MSQVFPGQALLLMAHGSRDADARSEYRRIHAALIERLAPTSVVFSVLEFPGDDGLPSIVDGWKQCLVAGARRIVALPFFLFPAGHVREDLPGVLRKARAAGGWADLELLPPLGTADELLAVLDTRAGEAAGGAAAEHTAVILVGAGTSDPDANGDLCKAARLFWERSNERYPQVEAAWVSLTRPTVSEVIDRAVRLGADQIVAVPYFLNTGVLLKRIDNRLAEAREKYPEVAITRGAHFGLHPSLLDLLERRARDGFADRIATAGLIAICGRPSCATVADGRAALLREVEPVG